jgi:transposase
MADCSIAKGYSKDLRERAVLLVGYGESRREAARVLNVAPSTAVRWLNHLRSTESVEAKL